MLACSLHGWRKIPLALGLFHTSSPGLGPQRPLEDGPPCGKGYAAWAAGGGAAWAWAGPGEIAAPLALASCIVVPSHTGSKTVQGLVNWVRSSPGPKGISQYSSGLLHYVLLLSQLPLDFFFTPIDMPFLSPGSMASPCVHYPEGFSLYLLSPGWATTRALAPPHWCARSPAIFSSFGQCSLVGDGHKLQPLASHFHGLSFFGSVPSVDIGLLVDCYSRACLLSDWPQPAP